MVRQGTSRYVSPPEALWRLFSYRLHGTSHNVVRLPVHLEGFHTVYFVPGQEQERLQNPRVGRTKLTAFFELNVTDEQVRQYLYQDIPLHNTWVSGACTWRRRQRAMATVTLCRMYAVNPLDRDRFILRLLLLHKMGPQSFQDMKTVDGIMHNTYAGAVVALGLLENDRALMDSMAESALIDTPAQLRYLFLTMLLYCDVSNPVALYEANAEHMKDDFLHRLGDVQRATAAC